MPVAVRERRPPALTMSLKECWNWGWDWIGLSPEGKEILFGEGRWVWSFERAFQELCHPGHGIVEWYPGDWGAFIVVALSYRGEGVRVLAQPTLLAERDPAECAKEAFHMAFGGRLGVR